MRRYEEAITTLRESVARNPNFVPAHRFLAAQYAELGRMKEARAEVAEVLRISPRASLEDMRRRWAYKDQAVLERILGALRKAGLPEKSRSTAP